MPNGQIGITLTVAKYMLEQAQSLVSAGLGQDIHGTDLGHPGEIDNIPMESETYRWAAGAVRFIRYLAGILAYKILEESENLDPTITGAPMTLDMNIEEHGEI